MRKKIQSITEEDAHLYFRVRRSSFTDNLERSGWKLLELSSVTLFLVKQKSRSSAKSRKK